MAKVAKPNFLHTSPVAAPKISKNDNRKKKRERLALKQGVYKDPRAAKHGQVRTSQAMTDVRWKKIIAAIANGAGRKEAAKEVELSVQSIDAYLISNVAAYKQMRDAKLAWNRRGWDTELIEDVFEDMACGLSLKKSCKKHDIEDRYNNLMRLIHNDKQIRASYDDARELWAESFLDDTIDIADNSTKDRLENGRINHEVVNRSKLRIEARWRAMGAMVKKRFGDSKHVEIEGSISMNHIATLTGARKRLEKIRPDTAPMKIPVTVDNETGEVAEA